MKIRSAYIEIIDVCNLNCRSCYNRSGAPKKRQNVVSLNKLFILANRLRDEFGCSRITLSGGEPTLHPQFGELLAALLDQRLDVAVVTNGTTGCRALLDAYGRFENLTLQVSLDGSCEEVNARTRGAGSFQKTADFLASLPKKSPPPRLKMTVSQLNVDDVPAFYDLAVSLGCLPDYDFISRQGNAAEVWDGLALSAQQKLRVLRQVNAKNQEHGIEAQLPYCTGACPLSDEAAELSVLIKSDGTMQPCQLLYNGSYSIGNLLTDSAEDMQENFLYRIVSTVRKREAADFGCTRCAAKHTCKKGCMALAVANNQDALGDDGECDYRKLQLLGFFVPKYSNVPSPKNSPPSL